MIILAGDIGGTKTNLAYFEVRNDELVLLTQSKFPSQQFPTFDELVLKFVRENPRPIDRACFGVAGPCRNGRCQAMNLPWVVDAQQLQRDLKIPSVMVINDLEATAYAISVLPPTDFDVIQTGEADPQGHAAVIAAGTGLGEAGLMWDGTRHRPFASEGGHCDFSPSNALEADLFKFLHKEFGHVAWERLLSGRGLYNIYRYFDSIGHARAEPSVVEEFKHTDPAAVIAKAAQEQRCPVCVAALNLFGTLYGSEAGNLALKMMATGGIYIGGGIAPKILSTICQTFSAAFVDKGRLKTLLEKISVYVILTNEAALIGAAQCARIH